MIRVGILALILSVLFLGGCSSSQTSEEGSSDDIPTVEAQTDTVPSEGGSASTGDATASSENKPAENTSGEAKPPENGTTENSQANAQPAEGEKTQDPAATPPPPDSAQTPPAEGASPPTDTAAATPPADSTPHPASASDADHHSGSAGGPIENYTVHAGDTLMKIAFETYGDLYKWKSIYEANKDKIRDPNSIPEGTVLAIEKPSTPISIQRDGEKYWIKRGDTLGSISYDVYGTKTRWRQLWENNRQLIRDPNRIFAGFYLYYVITPEEKQEMEKVKELKQSPLASVPMPSQAQPLASGTTSENVMSRMPASVANPGPTSGATVANTTPEAGGASASEAPVASQPAGQEAPKTTY